MAVSKARMNLTKAIQSVEPRQFGTPPKAGLRCLSILVLRTADQQPFRMRAYRCIKCDTRFYALAHFQKEDSSRDKVA
jgi:hypothetical protein